MGMIGARNGQMKNQIVKKSQNTTPNRNGRIGVKKGRDK
jgi:hypothetical protein